MKEKQKIKHLKLSPEKGKNKILLLDKRNNYLLALIVGLFGLLLYSNTFSHGYVLDDFSAIKENNIVRQGIHAIPEIFNTSYRQGYLSVKDGLYRPLSLVSYAMEWSYSPNNPGLSHFINVLLYSLTGSILFLALTLLFSFSSNTIQTEKGKHNVIIAFITSLLFMAHPLHTEVVANIKSRDELLCFLFVILSLLSVLKYVNNKKYIYLFLSMSCYLLSLLSKETSITFLIIIPLAMLLFTTIKIQQNIIITACFAGIAVIFLVVRRHVLGAISPEAVSLADNLLVGAKTFSSHVGTAFYILGIYLLKNSIPYSLSYDYSFNQIPLVEITNFYSIISLLIYFTFGCYAGFILYGTLKKNIQSSYITIHEKSEIAFGILFFLITIFLFSNLVLIIGTSMGDRLMYFPSLGFCIVVAVLLRKFLKIEIIYFNQLLKNVKFIPILIILVLFSYRTYTRNMDWKDNYTLYSRDVNKVPNSVKAHYYLGLELIKSVAEAEQDPEKKKTFYLQGIAELAKAVKILPEFASAYTQMGVAYFRLKNYDLAIKNYNQSAEYRPLDAITLNNIGSVFFEWQKYDEAAEKFQAALTLDSRFVDAHLNLGSVLGVKKEYAKAIQSFQNAIRFAPDNATAYYYISITYVNMGDKASAEKFFLIAKKINPKLSQPWS